MSEIDWKIFVPDSSEVSIYLWAGKEKAHIHSVKNFSMNYEKELVFRDNGIMDRGSGMSSGEDISTTKPVIRYEVTMGNEAKQILCKLFADAVNPGVLCTRRSRITIEKEEEEENVTALCSIETIPSYLKIDSLQVDEIPPNSLCAKIVVKVLLNELTNNWKPIKMGRVTKVKKEVTRFDLMDL